MGEIDKTVFDILTLRRDLYILTSLLLADKEMAQVKAVIDWASQLHDNEVNRLVLWVAAAARGLLDLQGGEVTAIGKQCCGEYWASFPRGQEKALTFRRACNSVIHAAGVLPYNAPLRPAARRLESVAYVDRITIRGIHRGENTRAQLDIIQFARIVDILINTTLEHDHADQ